MYISHKEGQGGIVSKESFTKIYPAIILREQIYESLGFDTAKELYIHIHHNLINLILRTGQ